jgi:hypothetical protein
MLLQPLVIKPKPDYLFTIKFAVYKTEKHLIGALLHTASATCTISLLMLFKSLALCTSESSPFRYAFTGIYFLFSLSCFLYLINKIAEHLCAM